MLMNVYLRQILEIFVQKVKIKVKMPQNVLYIHIHTLQERAGFIYLRALLYL